MKLLIFSDIHNDMRALQKLMDIEADRYIAAGDLVNLGRGLDAAEEVMKPKADKVFVLPGNHESVREISIARRKIACNRGVCAIPDGNWTFAPAAARLP